MNQITNPLIYSFMKKSYPFLLVLVFPIALLIIANSSGSVGGKTGSPGDGGSTCTDCHAGDPVAVTGWINSNIPPEGYTPGSAYNLTAVGNHTGVVLFGFELTAEDVQGNKVGTLTVTDPLQTQLTNSNNAITHTSNGITPIGNMKTWNMGWTAPAEAIGEITFYATFNAANGNGNTSGDVIYTSTLTVDNAAPPVLVSIDPNQGTQGENVVTTIIGDHTFFNASTTATLVYSEDPGQTIEGTDIEVIGNEEIQATFNLDFGTTPGMYDLNVDDIILEDAFEVLASPPAITLISPSAGNQGEEYIDARINGFNTAWTSGVSQVFLSYNDDPGEVINGSNIDVISDTYIEFDFSVPLDASTGSWDVHVDDLVLIKGFTLYTPVAVEENDISQATVYPNPSNGLVNIDGIMGAQVKIYNSIGEMVYSLDETFDHQRIDLTSMPKGVYFLQIVKAKEHALKKIILSK
jgi:hypothetical protein